MLLTAFRKWHLKTVCSGSGVSITFNNKKSILSVMSMETVAFQFKLKISEEPGHIKTRGLVRLYKPVGAGYILKESK